jgi:hypothetical protein
VVTLPGAFVGAIFGGASPLEAGRFQLVVLAAILAAGAVTAVGVTYALAPVSVRPGAVGERLPDDPSRTRLRTHRAMTARWRRKEIDMPDLGGLGDKAKDAASGGAGEKASDAGLDKAGDAASSATGGKADDKIDGATDAADKKLGG